MLADAIQFEVLAIEPEARLGIEAEVTETRGGLHFVNHLTADHQLRAYLIHIWVLTRPLPWPLDVGRLARSIQPHVLHRYLLVGRILVVHLYLAIVYKHAPMLHMDGIGLRQPHVAIDAAARIPAAVGLVAIIHAHSHHVLALLHVGRNIVFKRTVAVRPVANFLTVDIDRRIHIYPVKLQEITVIADCFTINGKVLSIPTYTARQSASRGTTGITHLEVALNSPVVRHVELPPPRIVILGLRHLSRVAQQETPVAVKVQSLSCLCLQPHQRRQQTHQKCQSSRFHHASYIFHQPSLTFFSYFTQSGSKWLLYSMLNFL